MKIYSLLYKIKKAMPNSQQRRARHACQFHNCYQISLIVGVVLSVDLFLLLLKWWKPSLLHLGTFRSDKKSVILCYNFLYKYDGKCALNVGNFMVNVVWSKCKFTFFYTRSRKLYLVANTTEQVMLINSTLAIKSLSVLELFSQYPCFYCSWSDEIFL